MDDAVTAERERIRQLARECEATYPFQINLHNGESYWVAIPFEDHPALVDEQPDPAGATWGYRP